LLFGRELDELPLKSGLGQLLHRIDILRVIAQRRLKSTPMISLSPRSRR
jgi:hypothetical protein